MVKSPTTLGHMSAKFHKKHTSPANQTQCYRALIHNVSLACSRMQTYSGQMYPSQLTLVLQSTTTPHFIKPGGTEPYYTRSVSHVAECRCTQVSCTPMPPLIEPSHTEHYYTRWVWYVEEFRCTNIRLHPHTNWTTLVPTTTPLHHVSLTCGQM